MLQTALEAGLPVRDRHPIGSLYLTFVQHTIMRTSGRRGIVFRLDRDHPLGQVRQLQDLHREIIPAAYPLVREVIGARHEMPLLSLCHDREHGIRQITRIGRCAYLIEDKAQLIPLSAQPQHGLHEVITILRIEPDRANDHRLRSYRPHRHLTR